eukprot:6172258-Pleurochrysis_carterae.AAC.3
MKLQNTLKGRSISNNYTPELAYNVRMDQTSAMAKGARATSRARRVTNNSKARCLNTRVKICRKAESQPGNILHTLVRRRSKKARESVGKPVPSLAHDDESEGGKLQAQRKIVTEGRL